MSTLSNSTKFFLSRAFSAKLHLCLSLPLKCQKEHTHAHTVCLPAAAEAKRRRGDPLLCVRVSYLPAHWLLWPPCVQPAGQLWLWQPGRDNWTCSCSAPCSLSAGNAPLPGQPAPWPKDSCSSGTQEELKTQMFSYVQVKMEGFELWKCACIVKYKTKSIL